MYPISFYLVDLYPQHCCPLAHHGSSQEEPWWAILRVAAVLLYGSESWSISAYDLRALEGFHVEATRRLTGMRPTKRGETWVYPHSADVLRAAHLRTIRESIARRRQTVLQAIADRPILEECRRAERR